MISKGQSRLSDYKFVAIAPSGTSAIGTHQTMKRPSWSNATIINLTEIIQFYPRKESHRSMIWRPQKAYLTSKKNMFQAHLHAEGRCDMKPWLKTNARCKAFNICPWFNSVSDFIELIWIKNGKWAMNFMKRESKERGKSQTANDAWFTQNRRIKYLIREKCGWKSEFGLVRLSMVGTGRIQVSIII